MYALSSSGKVSGRHGIDAEDDGKWEEWYSGSAYDSVWRTGNRHYVLTDVEWQINKLPEKP